VTAARRIRLEIAYDGGGFHGWASQPGLRTVQGVLEEALATVLRRHPPAPRLVVAGRTDAGVHATGQVAHLDLTDEQLAALVGPRGRRNEPPADPPSPAEAAGAVARRITGVLGPYPDVVVASSRLAPDGFDARFSAVWRRYRYRVADGAARHDPLQRHRTAWHPVALDAEAMDRAARSLCGLHDFAAYCKPREGATTIRTLQEFRWARGEDGVLEARLQADAFCHSMVRALVGACVAVGEGRLDAEDPLRLREAAERTSAFIVMPARGLTLTEVGYPPDADLAARARQTRALRTIVPSATPGQTPSPRPSPAAGVAHPS